MVQVAYNVDHKHPWHWPVPAYLVTKAIASGLVLVFAALVGLRLVIPAPGDAQWIGLLSLIFIGLTTGLLVFDLERPERFLSILLRPQWRSWLTRGAVILIGFSAAIGCWWGLELAARFGWLGLNVGAWQWVLPIVAAPFAVGAAIYTAFLFAQAEGVTFGRVHCCHFICSCSR